MAKEMTAAKTVAAAIGTTLTAISTALAVFQLVISDGEIGAAEYGTLAAAGATLVATVYAVWRTPNQDKNPGQGIKLGGDWPTN